jgi:hypothetical protein
LSGPFMAESKRINTLLPWKQLDVKFKFDQFFILRRSFML